MSPLREKPLSGRTVLFVILGCFAVVVAANAAMAIFALSSHPGQVTPNAYLEGLRYNDRLREARAQAARGRRFDVSYDPAGRRLLFRAHGADSDPVSGLHARLRLRRPGAGERTVTLRETAPGVYAATATLPLPGRWLVRIDGVDAQGRPVRVERELWRE